MCAWLFHDMAQRKNRALLLLWSIRFWHLRGVTSPRLSGGLVRFDQAGTEFCTRIAGNSVLQCSMNTLPRVSIVVPLSV